MAPFVGLGSTMFVPSRLNERPALNARRCSAIAIVVEELELEDDASARVFIFLAKSSFGCKSPGPDTNLHRTCRFPPRFLLL